ncbi:MAG: diadenylate cyclase [Ghiorsea sp.]|nr:diadenylate cyclase [Ghiorsea sp.]
MISDFTMLLESFQLSFIDFIDIGIVALVVYYVLRLIRGTHAEQMLIGLLLMLVLYEVARIFGLLTVEWIFNQVFAVFIVILVVLFQAEIRKGLMRVAVNPLSTSIEPQDKLINEVVEATHSLVKKRWGALLVFERETGLKHLDESGVVIHAEVNADLIVTLFCPDIPLHDGALLLGLDHAGMPEIRAARVLLPLAKSKHVLGAYGTRHRAAIGLSEENDALVLVVSEERGDIHLVENGEMSESLHGNELRKALALGLASIKFTGSSKT